MMKKHLGDEPTHPPDWIRLTPTLHGEAQSARAKFKD